MPQNLLPCEHTVINQPAAALAARGSQRSSEVPYALGNLKPGPESYNGQMHPCPTKQCT